MTGIVSVKRQPSLGPLNTAQRLLQSFFGTPYHDDFVPFDYKAPHAPRGTPPRQRKGRSSPRPLCNH